MTAALPRSVRPRTLNALMATTVGTAPPLRRDVDAVLRVFEADDDTDPGLGPEGLAAAATQMLKLLAPQQPAPAIAVLDHRDLPYDALWAPERIADALAMTGESADVLFWVVGLQDQYLSGPRARSARWRQAYDEAVEGLHAMAARQAGRRRLTVVVL